MNNQSFIIQVSKRDVIWGYFAQFFSLATGVIILPLVLKMLTPEEVGMNYLMLSVGSLVTLVDFGFSPQFGRNITYVYSGVQLLLKNGIDKNEDRGDSLINYALLSSLIQTARWVYSLLALIVFLLMFTLGTLYIYHITNGFENVSNSLVIWIIFSITVSLDIYYSYYSALLTGSGKIKESKKAIVFSSVAKIILTLFFLLCKMGLLGLVLANLIHPFFNRLLSQRYYFTADLKDRLLSYKTSFFEKKKLFKIIWSNSSKMGLCAISGYLTYGAATLFIGYYLTLSDVASYGLINQLITLLNGLAGILFAVYQPRLASLRVQNMKFEFLRESALSITLYYIFYLIGALIIIFIFPKLIVIIGSRTMLPSIMIISTYAFFRFLDGNYWNLAQLIISNNEFPFLKSTLVTALGIIVGSFAVLYCGFGLCGIIVVTGIFQCLYNNWYWPNYVMVKLNTNIFKFVMIGLCEIKSICFRYVRLIMNYRM